MNKLNSLYRKKKVLECYHHVLSKSQVDDRSYQIEIAYRYYRKYYRQYGKLTERWFSNITYRYNLLDIEKKIEIEKKFVSTVKTSLNNGDSLRKISMIPKSC